MIKILCIYRSTFEKSESGYIKSVFDNHNAENGWNQSLLRSNWKH